MQSKIFLPHLIAVTIDEKLSSKSMIPDASLATSVPYMPIANPISAFFNAGASFVPSPVTATTLSNYFNPVTNINLSSGLDLASTLSSLATNLKFSRSPTTGFVTLFSSMNLIPPTNSLNVFPSNTINESELYS